MLGIIGQILAGGGLARVERVIDRIADHKRAELDAMTAEDQRAHEQEMLRLERLADILVEEQKHWRTAWVRPAFAAVMLIYVAKLFIWDSVLGLGSTPEPGELMRWLLVTVVGSFFLARPFEKFLGRKG